MKYLATIMLLQISWQITVAQLPSEKQKGWVKGLILSATDMKPVPFASVMVDGTNLGQRTDSLGKFQLRIDSGDVLRVTHLSYQTKYLQPKFSGYPDHVVIFLRPDSSDLLPGVAVRQWSLDQFLKVKINDSLNRIARENVSEEKLQALRYSTATNGSDSYSLQRQTEAKKKALSNRVPYFAMFDLVNWYKIWQGRKRKPRNR